MSFVQGETSSLDIILTLRSQHVIFGAVDFSDNFVLFFVQPEVDLAHRGILRLDAERHVLQPAQNFLEPKYTLQLLLKALYLIFE